MTQAELYIEKYKTLEKVVRDTYGLNYADSISFFLSRQDGFSKYKEDIRYCQEVRNWLQHSKKVNGQFAITPNDAVLQFIDALIAKVRNRPRCIDAAVKIESVYTETLDGKVKNTIAEMRKRQFAHIPIVRGGVVIGVFDENSVFNYLAEEQQVRIDEELTFGEIEKYTRLDNREMEIFTFAPCHTYLDELEERFEKAFHQGKRIGMAFLTADGQRTSPLKGIITAWDIIAADTEG